MVQHNIEVGPQLNLSLPLLQSAQRRHNQKRPSAVLAPHQVIQQCRRLNSLAEAHFVRQDAVAAVVPVEDHPVDALQLVVTQREPVLVLWRLAVLDPLGAIGPKVLKRGTVQRLWGRGGVQGAAAVERCEWVEGQGCIDPEPRTLNAPS